MMGPDDLEACSPRSLLLWRITRQSDISGDGQDGRTLCSSVTAGCLLPLSELPFSMCEMERWLLARRSCPYCWSGFLLYGGHTKPLPALLSHLPGQDTLSWAPAGSPAAQAAASFFKTSHEGSALIYLSLLAPPPSFSIPGLQRLCLWLA